MHHLFLDNTSYTLLLAVRAIVVGRIIGPLEYGLYTVVLIVPPFLFTAIRLGLEFLLGWLVLIYSSVSQYLGLARAGPSSLIKV